MTECHQCSELVARAPRWESANKWPGSSFRQHYQSYITLIISGAWILNSENEGIETRSPARFTCCGRSKPHFCWSTTVKEHTVLLPLQSDELMRS